MSQKADSLRSVMFALGANLLIALAKSIAAWFSGSSAMLAESVHSVADTGNQMVLLLGMRHARRPPTPEHPLGFGRSIYFWSFIVALLLFSVGGVVSISEGWHKLGNPQPLQHPMLVILVLLFSLLAEGVSLWGCLREVRKVQQGRSLWRWFRETRQSELMVVLGEDLAALLGLAIALLAVVATAFSGNGLFDAAGSMVIGLLLVVVAGFLGREIKGLLVGESVEPRRRAAMRAFLEQCTEIDRVFNLLTLQMGNDVMVAVKAQMTACESAQALINAINRCETAFRAEFTEVAWLFFEPDTED